MSVTPIWEEVVASALMGTGRKPFAKPSAPAELDAVLAGLNPSESERALLGAAATLALYRRAGRLPVEPPKAPIPPPCPRDDIPRCSPASASHLAQMLAEPRKETPPAYIDVLPEFLAKLAAKGRRVPETLVPSLLEVGSWKSAYRDAIRPVLGARGRWVAAQNPAWKWVAGEVEDSSGWEEIWQTGSRDARVEVLKRLRAQEPAKARDWLVSGTKGDPADLRAKFVEVLTTNLSDDDETFLEALLDDRSKQVREAATTLLGQLSKSAYCRRMTERARALVTVVQEKKGKEPTLDVKTPEECDKSMLRDGFETVTPLTPEIRVGWALRIFSVVPPSEWSTPEMPPSLWLDLAAKRKNKKESPPLVWMIRAWTDAAILHRDLTWAKALMEHSAVNEHLGGYLHAELAKLLPPEEREELVLRILRSEQFFDDSSTVIPLLDSLPDPWSQTVSLLLLMRSREAMTRKNKHGYNYAFWRIAHMLGTYAVKFPLGLAEEAAAGPWPTDDPQWNYMQTYIEGFVSVLQFRQALHEELDR